MLYPILQLSPVLKDYIWGGTKLKTAFNKLTNLEKIAESWELSCHLNGSNTIKDSNILLKDFLKEHPEMLGDNCKKFNDFPILIKLIDANDNLSIQVHPSDNYALNVHNSYGKTEFWYVVDCAKDSYIYFGLNENITKNELIQRIENNTLINILKKVPIKKGDTFFIESGTIHAICKNTLIAEIQQNSDITYRIYDYDRIDKNGKKRDLHLTNALDVISLQPTTNTIPKLLETSNEYTSYCLIESKYFITYKYNIRKQCALFTDNTSFASIIVLEGNGTLLCNNETIELKKGDSLFIPANIGQYSINGDIEILITKIP